MRFTSGSKEAFEKYKSSASLIVAVSSESDKAAKKPTRFCEYAIEKVKLIKIKQINLFILRLPFYKTKLTIQTLSKFTL